MEHHLHDNQPCWILDTTAELTAVQEAAQAVQFAPEQRLDHEFKHTARQLGELACAHAPLHLTADQMQTLTTATRFYLGTAHYDTLQRRAATPSVVIESAKHIKQLDVRDMIKK